jgi:hypothetical protein
MKVKINSLRKNYRHRLTFDNNTTFGIGNVQPLFCKFLPAHSKVNLSLDQLVRLAPMVVPSFARLKVDNKVNFVPVSQVFPAYDALLSSTPINGSKSYTPNQVPCISNVDLVASLLANYSTYACFDKDFNRITAPKPAVAPEPQQPDLRVLYLSESALASLLFSLFESDYQTAGYSYHGSVSQVRCIDDSDTSITPENSDYIIQIKKNSSSPIVYGCFRLTQHGRYWYSVLRGLGYSLDATDRTPLSVLPYLAFAKAYFDVYQPKRFLSWHSTVYYKAIISDYYNYTTKRGEDSSVMIHSFPYQLLTDYGGVFKFPFFSTLSEDFVSACQMNPINNQPENGNTTDSIPELNQGAVSGNVHIPAYDLNTSSLPTVTAGVQGISADRIPLLARLYNFVEKSSVVGQSVKDWFRVHLGSQVNDDMFDASSFVKAFDNTLNINTVVSTAQTSNGDIGDNLGSLAGQGYGQTSSKCDFDTRDKFGFLICLSSVLPVSRLSTGNQYDLCATTLYQQPLPEFDGIGYELEPRSSFFENTDVVDKNASTVPINGRSFGYMPRLSNLKAMKNVRSGGFALRSVRDSYLPYCLDTIPYFGTVRFNNANYYATPDDANTSWRYPWANAAKFVSFNRLFYNVDKPIDTSIEDIVDDNFMSQSSFTIDITTYLKPISDTFVLEDLKNDLIEVNKE